MLFFIINKYSRPNDLSLVFLDLVSLRKERATASVVASGCMSLGITKTLSAAPLAAVKVLKVWKSTIVLIGDLSEVRNPYEVYLFERFLVKLAVAEAEY